MKSNLSTRGLKGFLKAYKGPLIVAGLGLACLAAPPLAVAATWVLGASAIYAGGVTAKAGVRALDRGLSRLPVYSSFKEGFRGYSDADMAAYAQQRGQTFDHSHSQPGGHGFDRSLKDTWNSAAQPPAESDPDRDMRHLNAYNEPFPRNIPPGQSGAPDLS